MFNFSVWFQPHFQKLVFSSNTSLISEVLKPFRNCEHLNSVFNASCIN